MSKQGNTGKQSLQKFTEFEKLTTVEDFKGLQQTDPKQLEQLCNWLTGKLNVALKAEPPEQGEIDKYANRVERVLEVMGDSTFLLTQFKRDRWYINEGLIKTYIHNTLVNKRYLPTNTQISDATGLSRVTVNKHIKENNLSDYKADEREKYRILNSTALNQLYYLAFQNADVKALKMFIELTKDTAGSSGVVNNNYIQINNTRIDNVLVEKLPAETRIQIENLIRKNLPAI